MSTLCRSRGTPRPSFDWDWWNLKWVQLFSIFCAKWPWVNTKELGSREDRESQDFKKLQEVDFHSGQFLFFFSSWALHVFRELFTDICISMFFLSCAGERWGADAGWVGQDLLRYVQSHTGVVLLVFSQILCKNRNGLKYGESGHPESRQQEVKLLYSVSLSVSSIICPCRAVTVLVIVLSKDAV